MSNERAQPHKPESWDSAEAYDVFMARWSRLVAREFLARLSVPSGRAWLDIGCGTGGLSQAILETANPTVVHGFDISETYIAYAKRHVIDPRARFRVGHALDIPIEEESYDAVVSGLVLNILPDADRGDAILGMVRAARRGGLVAAYVWDYADGMQVTSAFWDAVTALGSRGRPLDVGHHFSFCSPDLLSALFQASGLRDVQIQSIDVPTVFRDFDDYWLPFLGGGDPAPAYAISLSTGQREEVRKYLQSHLPIAQDGSIHLSARAWAMSGIKG
jgi:SAM-dependent methyltransferase